MDDYDVVADSEGEEIEIGLPKARRRYDSSIETAETTVLDSSIETAETTVLDRHGHNEFRRVSDALLNSNLAGRSRRPVFRIRQGGETDASTSLIDTSIHNIYPHEDDNDMNLSNTFSIADRAKTRQRNAKRHSLPYPGPSAQTSPPSDGEDELYNTYNVPGADEEYAGDVRPKPRLQTKKHLLDAFLDESDPPGTDGKVIYEPDPFLPPPPPVLHTPENRLELLSPPPAQTRPKPRPIKRGQKTNATVQVTTNQTLQQEPKLQLSIPIATSPLPPSDPPEPSSTSRHHSNMENEEYQETIRHGDGLPPIEILPNPASSPPSLSSLFSVGEGEDAHIAGDTGHVDNLLAPEEDPLLLGPPSTFFTGSSSPPPPPQPKPRKKQKVGEEHVEIIDLCTVPPKSTDIQIMEVDEAEKNGKKAKGIDDPATANRKTKTKGKRKANDDDDFCLDDNGDREYEDKGRKRKAKTRIKEKSTNGKRQTKTRKIVEVVIDVPKPRSKGITIGDETPGGRKPRSPVSSVSNKGGKVPSTPHRSASTGNQANDAGSPISSVPDSEEEDMQGLFDVGVDTPSSRKAKTNAAAPPPAPSPTPSPKRKRRTSDVYNDDGLEFEAGSGEERATTLKKAKTKGSRAEPKRSRASKTGKARVVLSDDEEDCIPDASTKKSLSKDGAGRVSPEIEDEGEDESAKENAQPHSSGVSSSGPGSKSPTDTHNHDHADTKPSNSKPKYPSLASQYTIAPKTRPTSMSELIRRVNSMPLSLFTLSPSANATNQKDAKSTTSTSTPIPASRPRSSQGVTAYSPYLKSSRSLLSKIAPLHPNRRTPPPPPPPPPPRKKSKKELELEEKWEEELIESVGGAAAWSCLPEDVRKEMKRVKWAVERGEMEG